jgi:hypothetical protein
MRKHDEATWGDVVGLTVVLTLSLVTIVLGMTGGM